MSERGGEVRRLDRPPGERYAPKAPAPGTPGGSGPGGRGHGWSRRRRIVAAAAAALGTAVVTFLFAGFDLGPGFLAIGAGGGWITGLALAGGEPPGRGAGAGRGRAITGAVLAGVGVALGLTLDAIRSLAEGGVLAPWDYAAERFGALALAFVAVAAVAAALRGR
jgi:hypothetical protein